MLFDPHQVARQSRSSNQQHYHHRNTPSLSAKNLIRIQKHTLTGKIKLTARIKKVCTKEGRERQQLRISI